MTDKLVVIIKIHKVPKIKKMLLYEMKFVVPNYSCLQNPWLGGYRPQIPVLSALNWICWTPPPEQNSWVRYYGRWGRQPNETRTHWSPPKPTPLAPRNCPVGRILHNERRHLTSPTCSVCSTADSQQQQVRHLFPTKCRQQVAYEPTAQSLL